MFWFGSVMLGSGCVQTPHPSGLGFFVVGFLELINARLVLVGFSTCPFQVQHFGTREDATHPQTSPTTSQKVYVSSQIGSKIFCSLRPCRGKGHKTRMALQLHQASHPVRLRNAFHFYMKDLKVNQNTAISPKPALLIIPW